MPGSHFRGDVNLIKKIRQGECEVINIPPQALNVIWGADDRYWKIQKEEGSPAELVQVCWLEVTGNIPVRLLEKEKEYRLVFNLELKPNAFGWKESPVRFMVKRDKRFWKRKTYDLGSVLRTASTSDPPGLKFQVPKDAKVDDMIPFGMYEIWKGTWKGGLIINSVQLTKIVN